MAVIKAEAYYTITLANAVGWMLEEANAVHSHHLENCVTYAEHTLTQELYECIRAYADKIAEVGKSLGILYIDGAIVEPTEYKESDEFPIYEINLLHNLLQAIRDKRQKYPALINVVDDFDTELLQIKYKLEIEYGIEAGILVSKKTRDLRILR